MGQDQHRSTLCDDVKCGGEWVDVQWSPDSSQVAFVSTSRNHQQANLRMADAATGAIREVLEEKGETFLESGNGRVNWRALTGSNEAIWFSQRDNWGQLYLHDLQTGKQKSQLTSGEGNVTQLMRVDEADRMLYYQGVGKERGRDPYFRHFYRQTMDGKPAQLLTPEDADHAISLSPSGKFFVDNFSKPDAPTTSVLRDETGKLVLQLEKMDISRLTGDRLEAADANHGEGSRRRQRALRPALPADELRSVEEVSDHQQHLSRSADRQRRQPPVLGGARSTRRRSPNSASSSCRSTAWARRGDRSGSTPPTTATWATTRCPTRSPA